MSATVFAGVGDGDGVAVGVGRSGETWALVTAFFVARVMALQLVWRLRGWVRCVRCAGGRRGAGVEPPKSFVHYQVYGCRRCRRARCPGG